jgi:hypothetical protein
MTDTLTRPVRGRLTAAQGTAMYVGAVVGTGVIALPALAADTAGPASLLAWLALSLISLPLAVTFAALGARHPDAGGVSTYARLAFGERAAAVVGWCFYLAVPTGATAAALFGGAYVAAAVGGGTTTTAVTAGALMALVTTANMVGLRLTGRLQLVLAALLVTLLLAAVALSLPQARADHLEPFAPHGWAAIGPAAALLVWSFAGWEAITHLAGEFRRPQRDLLGSDAFATDFVIDALPGIASPIAETATAGTYTFDSVYPALGSDTHTQLAEQVGARLNDQGCIGVDVRQRTSVPGLYAAGDVVAADPDHDGDVVHGHRAGPRPHVPVLRDGHRRRGQHLRSIQRPDAHHDRPRGRLHRPGRRLGSQREVRHRLVVRRTDEAPHLVGEGHHLQLRSRRRRPRRRRLERRRPGHGVRDP